MLKLRTGLADSHRHWATRSAMDDDGVPLLHLTLLAIDSDEKTVGCFRMGIGCCCRVAAVEEVTIDWGGGPASKGISSLPLMLKLHPWRCIKLHPWRCVKLHPWRCLNLHPWRMGLEW